MTEKMVECTSFKDCLHTILENISQGVIFVDLKGILVLFNDYAGRLLNIDANSVIGKIFSQFFTDDLFGFSMEEALHFNISHKLRYVTINEKEIEISATFLFAQGGNFSGLIVCLRDLTETQSLRREIRNNEGLKELGKLVATVSHEIRNSLGGIRGYAMLLERDLQAQKDLQDMAHYMIEGTKSLENLVTTILQYARPVHLKIETVNLVEFLIKLTKLVRINPAYPQNVDFKLHLFPIVLFAPIDPITLQSCLLNLIFNAFQAMIQGGVLTLSLLEQGNHYQIIIADTGLGISPQDLSRLFSPFFTTKKKGTGLGLVEAKKIAVAHGGQLDARSVVGRGTVFTLTLPLKR